MKTTYVRYERDAAGIITRRHDERQVAEPMDVEASSEWEPLTGWPEEDVYWDSATGPTAGWAPLKEDSN